MILWIRSCTMFNMSDSIRPEKTWIRLNFIHSWCTVQIWKYTPLRKQIFGCVYLCHKFWHSWHLTWKFYFEYHLQSYTPSSHHNINPRSSPGGTRYTLNGWFHGINNFSYQITFIYELITDNVMYIIHWKCKDPLFIDMYLNELI